MRKWCRVSSVWGMSAALVRLGGLRRQGPAKGRRRRPTAGGRACRPCRPRRRRRRPDEAVAAADAFHRQEGCEGQEGRADRSGDHVLRCGARRRHQGRTAIGRQEGHPDLHDRRGSGFIIVVEAKPGKSGEEVARRVFAYVPGRSDTPGPIWRSKAAATWATAARRCATGSVRTSAASRASIRRLRRDAEDQRCHQRLRLPLRNLHRVGLVVHDEHERRLLVRQARTPRRSSACWWRARRLSRRRDAAERAPPRRRGQPRAGRRRCGFGGPRHRKASR